MVRVLTQKVRCPAPVGLRRQRLLGPLLDGSSPPLVLVVAPGGCGKTTLLAQAAALSAIPVGWYRTDARDTSETAFVSHLASALRAVRSVDAGQVTTIDELLTLLDEDPGGEALLVVDDVHELTGSPAERSLRRFLDLRPPWLRILLAGRRRPAVNLPRLQVSCGLLEVDADDLRFRTWEVERLFSDLYAEPLPPEAAAALTRRTGGWAAGLQLFHLATRGRTSAERRAAVEALDGRSRLIKSYLTENVLAEMEPHLRFFVTRTCTLGVLTGPLCDELLGADGSDVVLQDLADSQLFTASEDGGRTFRYHQAFQDHLEAALEDELGTVRARRWYRRSAQVLERVGHVDAALRAHARAEDWESANRLVLRAGARLAEGCDPRVAEVLPDRLREHDPWLALAGARHQLRQGALTAALSAYRHAETLLDDAEFQERCRGEARLVVRWLPQPPPSREETPPSRPDADRHWSERLRDATVRLPVPDPSPVPGQPSVGDLLVSGLTRLLGGRFPEAVDDLSAVTAQVRRESVEGVVALLGCALAELLGGTAGSRHLEEAARAAETASFPWLERVCRAALELAVRDEADEVEGMPWQGLLRRCRSDGDEWGAALLLFIRGAVETRGRRGDPLPCLAEAAEVFGRLHAPVLAVWTEAFRALAMARSGAPEAATVVHRVTTAASALGVPAAARLASGAGTATGSEPPPRDEPDGPALNRPAVPAGAGAGHPEVRLRLLGGFRLDVGGRSADWHGVRPRALVLLRLLAVSPDVDVHRERLVDALWPGVGLPTGTHRLQVAVSSLRAALDRAGLPGSTVLARHGEAYRLALPPGTTVDVRELLAQLAEASAARARGRTAAAAAAVRRALALYQGELLPEDGPAEWVLSERDRLRRCVATAAGELAEDCLRLGAVGEGLGAARRALELDRYQDRAWELVTELHERAGDRAAAARARQEHADALAELSVPGLHRIGRSGEDRVTPLRVRPGGPPRGAVRGPA